LSCLYTLWSRGDRVEEEKIIKILHFPPFTVILKMNNNKGKWGEWRENVSPPSLPFSLFNILKREIWEWISYKESIDISYWLFINCFTRLRLNWALWVGVSKLDGYPGTGQTIPVPESEPVKRFQFQFPKIRNRSNRFQFRFLK